jgi:hypothetical protein
VPVLFNLTPSSGFKKSSFSDMTHNNHKRLTETGKLLLGTKRLLATPKIEHVVGILLDLFGEFGIPPLFCFYYDTTQADSAHYREVKVRLEVCLAFLSMGDLMFQNWLTHPFSTSGTDLTCSNYFPLVRQESLPRPTFEHAPQLLIRIANTARSAPRVLKGYQYSKNVSPPLFPPCSALSSLFPSV